MERPASAADVNDPNKTLTFEAASPADISTEPGFAAAVRQALPDFYRLDRLHSNPLLGSRLVISALAKSPAAPATRLLRDLIHTHCEQLGQCQKSNRYRQVLQLTYLTPLRRQRAVADTLHMSLSTYRRCLANATQILITSLWEAECELQQPAVRTPHRAASFSRHWLRLVTTIPAITIVALLLLYPHHVHPSNVVEPHSIAVNAESSNDYRVGIEYLDQQSVPALKQAIVYFQKSIEADQDNAKAWAALALTYVAMRTYSNDVSPDAHYAEILASADKALALDPSTPIAHVALGALHAQQFDWPGAQQEFQYAFALNPTLSVAHQWRAMYYWYIANPQQALSEIQAAHDADPPSPIINLELGRAYLYAGNQTLAALQLHKAAKLGPESELLYNLLAENDLNIGLYLQALHAAKMAAHLSGNPQASLPLMEQAVACIDLGKLNRARRDLAELQEHSASIHHYLSGVLLSEIYWNLGEKAQAFKQLQRAAQDRDPLIMMVSAPEWHSMRADARFAVIRNMMNLPVSP